MNRMQFLRIAHIRSGTKKIKWVGPIGVFLIFGIWMQTRIASLNQDLSRLEWDGNEVYFGAETKQEVRNILKNTIGILCFWKNELESKYPDATFYLFASYDNGDMQIVEEGELPVKSITLRFWADRGNDSVINLSDFDNWDQPAIIVRCNSE